MLLRVLRTWFDSIYGDGERSATATTTDHFLRSVYLSSSSSRRNNIERRISSSAMEPVATVAAVLSIISAIFGIINGGPDACRQAGELLSNNGNTKGEKKLNKIMTCLVWVQQKLQEEVKRRTDSNCSETSIRADLKPLDGEIADARSFISDWGNKNCLGKWWAAKEFKKKLEKSEEAIYQRFREFSFYTERYEATQHTNQTAKPATQHIDRGAISIHAESLIVTNCTLNLNQGPITIQPCSEHPQPSRIMKENYGHLMEKKNQNQLQMDKENIVHPSPMEKANQSPIEREKVHRPTRHEKVDKGDNRKSQLRMGKENDEHRPPMEKANQSAMERGKVHGPTTHEKVDKGHNPKSQLRMGKENDEHRPPMEKANQSPMQRGKVHGPTTREKVNKGHNRKAAPGKQGIR